jgi:hypothetical protein
MESFVLEELSNYCKLNPYEFTFIGIGTVPRYNDLEKFIPRVDQIMPPYLDYQSKTIRLLHFDNALEQSVYFLHDYFRSKNMNFKYDNSEGFHIWRSGDFRIEVIINPFYFSYVNHNLFLEQMINITLLNNAKLILQDYSGNCSSNIFKMLYDKSDNKQKFKESILFDISFGDNHCDLDPTKYEIIYDPNNNFLNIMLVSIDELRPYIDYHPFIKKYIEIYYIKEYRKIADVIPLDIRRKILIESGDKNIFLLSYKNLYSQESSYQDIIKILKQELQPIINILKEINYWTPEKDARLQELFDVDLSKVNLYEWTPCFIKILR